MDSLKLDRFRRLLNRQSTSINLTDAQQQSAAAAAAATATASSDQQQQQQQQSTATNNRISGAAASASAQFVTAQSSLSAITVSPPEFITRDHPRPAHFIARKLFCDFTELAHLKIDLALAHVSQQDEPIRPASKSASSSAAAAIAQHQQLQHGQSHAHPHQHSSHGRPDSIFRTLQRHEDSVYDQVLRALGTVSEYCLPSLLKYVLLWYEQQLDAYAERPTSPEPIPDDCTPLSPPGQRSQAAAADELQQQLQPPLAGDFESSKKSYHSGEISAPATSTASCDVSQQALAAECGCTSPCNNESHSFSNSTSACASHAPLRSPTPASPDLCVGSLGGQQISITSTLPLEYQSPAPQTTIVHQRDLESQLHQHQHQHQQQQQQQQAQGASNVANTSTSTATNTSLNSTSFEDSINMSKRSEILATRTMLIEYAFCQALIEIFGKLYLHPGHQDLIGQVEEVAFAHFKQVAEADLRGCSAADARRLAEKFADVIGVLAQTRFGSVKKRFLDQLAELRTRELTTDNIQSVCALLAGMRSFRIKMAPIEEFEASLQFLQELADYFVEVRHKSIKHALAELFVEVLLPLASIVKNEVKIPCLKNFVDTLWAPALDMCARKKHSATLFPLVTCLLCVSQRAIFLANWGSFLNTCLSNLKNRDQKMCRIALESLYRLVWIYMIRIKGESNNVTQARLSSIVDCLFPRGSRQIVPREMPLTIFVDIIQFIAQERLDFAMRHIIFDLLCVERALKVIMAPERMNVGLQAFLVIADSLQQKEGDPVMPITIGSASAQQLAQIMHQPGGLGGHSQASLSAHANDATGGACATAVAGVGGTYGPRRGQAHRMLNDETAKSIGLHPYYSHIQKSFGEILKALDAQFGRPLMLTALYATAGLKEPDADQITGDRRLRVDLFKTCVAAIPRLMPDGLSKGDLIDLLARMTIHVDEQMRRYAFESLRKLVVEFQDWRLDAIEGFTLFLANQIDESLWNLVDGALKMLLQLLISWHSIITSTSAGGGCGAGGKNTGAGFGANSEPSDFANGAGGGGGGSSGLLARSANSALVSIQTGYETISSRTSGTGGQIAARKNRALAEMRLIQSELSNTRFDRLVNVIQKVEGASLVMLCSCHSTTRKLASLSLRECRAILRCYSSWTCMEQFGFRSPAAAATGTANVSAAAAAACGASAFASAQGADCDPASGERDLLAGEEDNLSSVSLKGSLSADNLSRITTTSINGLQHSSMTSINTQAAMLSTSVSKMCIGGATQTAPANGALGSALGIGRSASICNNNASTTTTTTTTNNNNNSNVGSALASNQHDLYDEDMENNLAECYASEDSSNMVFWVAVMMLESPRECEYALALRLLKKILPNLPMGREDFLEELGRNLKQMQWDSFPGLHALVLRGCSSAATYDLCISLLDHLTPILGHPICARAPSGVPDGGGVSARSAIERSLPAHVLVLSTYLLATYEDPSSLSLNIARRLALCCEENSSKLENLAAVMTLYSRRSFSKDAFQWIKCVAKYLHDACPDALPRTIPLLLDMLASGPHQVQRLTLPILYCILTYADQAAASSAAATQETDDSNFNEQVLMRLYGKCLGSAPLWRDAMQIFRLIISKSSSLASKSPSSGTSSSGGGAAQLPGRTMDFSLEIESLPIAAKARLAELGIFPNAGTTAATTAAPSVGGGGGTSSACQSAPPGQAAPKCPQPVSQQHSLADESQGG